MARYSGPRTRPYRAPVVVRSAPLHTQHSDGFTIATGRFGRDPKARTFALTLNLASRAIESASRGERGMSATAILQAELYELMSRSGGIRDIFRKHAPEDETDREPWNNPKWWRPPTLKESIRLSTLMRHSLVGRMAGAEADVALQMRWYGWLTLTGRGPVHAVNAPYLRFKLKNGEWVTKKEVRGATKWSDLLTDMPPHERMQWAERAYEEAFPLIRAKSKLIASRIMYEVIRPRVRRRIQMAEQFGERIPMDNMFDQFMFFGPDVL